MASPDRGETENSDLIGPVLFSALFPHGKDAAIVQNTLEALLGVAFKVLLGAFPPPQDQLRYFIVTHF